MRVQHKVVSTRYYLPDFKRSGTTYLFRCQLSKLRAEKNYGEMMNVCWWVIQIDAWKLYQEALCSRHLVYFGMFMSMLFLLSIFKLLSALFSCVTSPLLRNFFAADRACSKTPPRSDKENKNVLGVEGKRGPCYGTVKASSLPAPTGTHPASQAQAGLLHWLQVSWGESKEQLAVHANCADLCASARGIAPQPACRHI